MENKNGPLSSAKALEGIYDFVQGPEENIQLMPITAVKKELAAEHIDVTSIQNTVKKLLVRERLRLAHERHEKLAALISRARQGNQIQNAREALQSLFRSDPRFALAYRKLEETPDEDMESLIDDVRILELLDEPDLQP